MITEDQQFFVDSFNAVTKSKETEAFFKNYDEEMQKYFNDKMSEEGWRTLSLNNQSTSLSMLDGIKNKVD